MTTQIDPSKKSDANALTAKLEEARRLLQECLIWVYPGNSLNKQINDFLKK